MNNRQISNGKGKNGTFVTIKDIANYVGVSTATVSMVLSGSPKISDETSQKVLEAIKIFNYRPSIAARSLVLNRTGVISLVVPQIENVFMQPFFSIALNGVYDACVENGFRLQIEVASFQFMKRKRYLRLFRERAIDGMIYIGSTASDTYLKELEKEEFPFIFAGSYLKKSSLPFVIGDNIKGGRIATAHLIKLGRKRIAHIIGNFSVPSAVDRFEGYKSELEKHGLNFDPHLVSIGNFSHEGGYEAMKKILKFKPDAVFVGNDIMAEGALEAIKEARIFLFVEWMTFLLQEKPDQHSPLFVTIYIKLPTGQCRIF